MTYVPRKLDIPDDLRQEIETALIERVRAMVQAADDRDCNLAEYEAQLDGDIEYGSGRGPWPGSCRLHDPLSREIHTQVLAKFAAQRPVIQVDAEQADKAMVEAAQKREAWLNTRLMAERFDVVWNDLAHNILRDPTCVLFVGWRQETRTVYRTQYHDGETFDEETGEPLLVTDEMRDPERVYDEIEVQDTEVVYSGRDYRAVDEANFYLYPSEAKSIHQSVATAERMRWTDEELMAGVRAYGYEEEKVRPLLVQGPTHDLDGNEFLEQRQERSGLNPFGDDGLYVCFLYHGTLPPLLDSEGESRLPEDLQGVQVCAVVCVRGNCVLKIAASPYDSLPYFAQSVLPVPNQFEGKGLMQLLRELQEEATANLRATIDGINLEMMPAQYATSAWIGKYANRYKHAPGAYIPRDTPGEVEPVQWANNAERGLNIHSLVQSRAQNMVGSENFGKMPSKQRRVIEVQNVMAAVDAKFSLLLGNFHRLLPDIAPWIAELELKFGDPQKMTLSYSGRQVTITADDLRQKFLYSTPATKADSDPSVRIEMAKAKEDVQARYFKDALQLEQMQRFDLMPLRWHAARNTLIEIDPNERMPENYIGPEPSGQSPQPVLDPLAPEEVAEGGGLPDVLQGLLPAMPGMAINGNGAMA